MVVFEGEQVSGKQMSGRARVLHSIQYTTQRMPGNDAITAPSPSVLSSVSKSFSSQCWFSDGGFVDRERTFSLRTFVLARTSAPIENNRNGHLLSWLWLGSRVRGSAFGVTVRVIMVWVWIN